MNSSDINKDNARIKVALLLVIISWVCMAMNTVLHHFTFKLLLEVNSLLN